MWVVPGFDPPSDRQAGLVLCAVAGSVDEFLLEGAEERFGCGVVPAHPGSADGLADAMSPAQAGGGRGCVLGAPIGVEHHTLDVAASGAYGFSEGVGDE